MEFIKINHWKECHESQCCFIVAERRTKRGVTENTKRPVAKSLDWSSNGSRLKN